MAVYTGTGDSGNTSLIGNVRKSKDSPVFEVLGTMDEFNATLGVILAEIEFSKDAKDFLIGIQSDLFKVGALIANPKVKEAEFDWLGERTSTVEKYIDELEAKLPRLTNFILPGGTPGAARVHFARTVCRRLERNIVNHYDEEKIGKKHVIRFVNRLSDLLFVLARYLNFNENVEDIIWIDSDE